MTRGHFPNQAFWTKQRAKGKRKSNWQFFLAKWNRLYCGSPTWIPQLDAETLLWLWLKPAEVIMHHYLRNSEWSLKLPGKKTVPSCSMQYKWSINKTKWITVYSTVKHKPKTFSLASNSLHYVHRPIPVTACLLFGVGQLFFLSFFTKNRKE